MDAKNGNTRFRESLIFTSLGETGIRVEARIKMLKPSPLFIAKLLVKKKFSAENPYTA